jgi:hypothetical protein
MGTDHADTSGGDGNVRRLPPRPGQPGPGPATDPRPFATVDLVELATAGVPAPELLCHGLLYRGALHSLAGPPDAGKSTLLYLWLAELLAAGHPAALIDEESGREATVEKFLALGITPAHLRRLAYVEFPGRRWDQADRAGLLELLGRVRPVLVGYDSAAALLATAGKDEDRATDTTPFYKLLLEASRAFDAASVILDHLPKDHGGNGSGGGRYARGSGAKLATVDVAFMVEPVKPFSRHQSGLLKLTVAKDRRGWLHRNHEIRVDVEDGTIALTFTQHEEAAGDSPSWSPAARKLLDTLRAASQPLTSRELVDLVAAKHGHGLRRETTSRELNAMLRDGLIDAIEDGNVKRWLPRPADGV